MKEYVIVLLGCMLVGCMSSPSNLEGKSFDADSLYCRQMQRESIALFRFDNDMVSNRVRGTNPKALSHKPISPLQLSNSKNAYELDCESRNAFRLRKK